MLIQNTHADYKELNMEKEVELEERPQRKNSNP
jgi:hypothetical protein